MTSYLNYLIEANILLLVFGGVYFLLLRKETDFKFRRFFILTSSLAVLFVPLVHFDVFSTGSAVFEGIETILLPELTIGKKNALAESATYSVMEIITVAYWVMAVIICQFFLFQCMQLIWFTFSNKTSIKKKTGYYLIYTNGTLPTFSFFNLLFFDNSIALNEKEKTKIMEHEKIHINQRHSLDVILLEITKILCWFNPLAWYLRREAQDIHEYLADDQVTQHDEKQQYTSLLAKMALSKAHLSLGHHFNKSKTLKRIKMMNTVKQKVKGWKMAVALPVVLITILAISCNDEVMQDVNTVMETASQVEMPEVLKPKLAELQQKYPNADFVYMETDDTSKNALSNLQGVDPLSIVYVQAFKEEGKVGAIVNRNGPIQNKADIDGVFTIVDEAASPEGGFEAFYQRLVTNLKYPEQARKMGIEGKVYVQFIVDKDGSLTDMKAVKGIGAGCDMAAIEAIKVSGDWSAPKQRGQSVKQRIILPITFKLDDKDEAGEDS